MSEVIGISDLPIPDRTFYIYPFVKEGDTPDIQIDQPVCKDTIENCNVKPLIIKGPDLGVALDNEKKRQAKENNGKVSFKGLNLSINRKLDRMYGSQFVALSKWDEYDEIDMSHCFVKNFALFNLKNVNLSHAIIRESSLGSAFLSNVCFDNANIENTTIGTLLDNCSFKNAVIKDCDLSKTTWFANKAIFNKVKNTFEHIDVTEGSEWINCNLDDIRAENLYTIQTMWLNRFPFFLSNYVKNKM